MSYIKRLCIFYLFAKIILHLCPKESYETYINALIEWTALVILITPLFTKNSIMNSYEMWEEKFDSFIGESAILSDEIPSILSKEQVDAICQNAMQKTVNEMQKTANEMEEVEKHDFE